MSILESAIQRAGGVSKLALELGVKQNVVSMWRKRGLSRAWQMALGMKYPIKARRVRKAA